LLFIPFGSNIINLLKQDLDISKSYSLEEFVVHDQYLHNVPAKWKRGFDGTLRPHMGLRFVDPRLYNQSRGAEHNFRRKILNYENGDTLTLRSSALSRMMQDVTMPTMHETMEMFSEHDVTQSQASQEVDTPCAQERVYAKSEQNPSIGRSDALTQNNVQVGCDVELI